MVAAMASAVERCYADGTTLLILDAPGRNFCTGFDLGDLNQQYDDYLLARFIRIELLLQAMQAATFFTFAVGHGRHIARSEVRRVGQPCVSMCVYLCSRPP